MRRAVIGFVSAVAAVVFTASSAGFPASASVSAYSAAPVSGQAIGLMVHYQQGYEANGLFGTLAGQDALTVAGIAVGSQRAIGQGWHTINFSQAVSEATAQHAASLMGAQQGVIGVEINRYLATPAAAPTVAKPKLPAATFKGASVTQKVEVKDAFSPLSPTTPQVSVAWAAPKDLAGKKLTGYEVQVSMDAGATFQDVPGVFGPKAKKALLSNGLTAGTSVSMRVAAVTTDGKTSKVGKFSNWASATPTTVPIAPTFSGKAVSVDNPTVSWQALAGADAGGLPVTYYATASADGQADANCNSTGTSCSFPSLAKGVSYTVKLRAANTRGSSASVSAFFVADPLYGLQWHLTSKYGINVEPAWQKTRGSSAVTVAVVDSGITEHPDLDNQLLRNTDGSVYGYDFVSLSNNPGDGDGWDSNPTDVSPGSEWHGTHVSGIIAASANNIGVVGIAPGVKLLEVRALGGSGGTSSDLIAALRWLAGIDIPGVPKNIHTPQVINMSLGNQSVGACDSQTQNVLVSLKAQNITVVTAAGNDASFADYSYPGNCVPTINVGATSFLGDRASYSNVGAVDISAPGGDSLHQTGAPDGSDGQIMSTMNSGTTALGTPDYELAEGTSMAAPMVSGVVALLYSVKSNMTFENAYAAMKASVTPFPVGSYCASYLGTSRGCGVGIVNASGAVDYALKNF